MTQIDYFLSQADPVLLLLTDRGRDHDGVDRRGVPADPGDLLLLEPGNQLAAGPVLPGWFGHGSPGPPRDPGWLARHAARGSPGVANHRASTCPQTGRAQGIAPTMRRLRKPVRAWWQRCP